MMDDFAALEAKFARMPVRVIVALALGLSRAIGGGEALRWAMVAVHAV